MELHQRVTAPFKSLLLFLLGLPFALAARSSGFFATSALCLGLCLVFLGVTMVGGFLGEGGIVSPALAAWLPYLVFAPPAAWRFARIPS